MSVNLQNVFLGLHVFGAILWSGGLLTLALLLAAAGRESGEPAQRLGALARKLGMWADLGATLAILFGLHRLFSMKLYKLPYIHIKIALVVVIFALHGILRARAKKVATGAAQGVPAFALPLLLATLLAICVVVLVKLPL